MLIIMVASLSLTVEALLLVQFKGGLIPYVTHLIDIEADIVALARDSKLAVCRGLADDDASYAGLVQYTLHSLEICVGYLEYYTRIFGKENLHNVLLCELAEVCLNAALTVGKGHLKQRNDETASADIVAGQYEAFANQLLHGLKGGAEIVCLFDRRHIAADLVETLCKGAAAQTKRVKGEVNMYQGSVFAM